MELRLKGKVAVITGGGTGIGKACALAFAEEGCKIAICGRRQDKLDSVKKEFASCGRELLAVAADASMEKQLEVFAELIYKQYGRIDIWVNNAGVSPKRRLLEMGWR